MSNSSLVSCPTMVHELTARFMAGAAVIAGLNTPVASAAAPAIRALPPSLPWAREKLHIGDGTIIFTGAIKTLGPQQIISAQGHFHIAAKTVDWPAASPRQFAFTRLSLDGDLAFWHRTGQPPHLTIRRGALTFASLKISRQVVHQGALAWRLRHQRLTITRGAAHWATGQLRVTGEFDLVPRRGAATIVLTHFSQQRLFALLAPGRVNVVGIGTLQAHLAFNWRGGVTGNIELTGRAGGFLQLHQVPLLRNVLAGTYGQPLANAMADDLHDYPFTREEVRVSLAADTMTFKCAFLRGPGNPLHLKPRVIVLGGKKILFKPGDLRRVNLTIPVRHLTLRRLLTLTRRFSGG